MLWITVALLLAASLTLPDLRGAMPARAYEFRSAFLLLLALIVGFWSSLQSLRVRCLVSSLLLMTAMLVGGFSGSTMLFLLGENLWKAFLGAPNALLLLPFFGTMIIFLGNLIAFLIVTSSRKIRNPNIVN